MYVCHVFGGMSHDIHLFCRKVSTTFILCFTIIVFCKHNFQTQLLEDPLLELQNSAWF